MVHISIVIPCHGRQELLSTALAAVRAQTVAPLETLVVDDGSDPPLQVEGPGFRCVRQDPGAGPAAARNAGAAAARGEILLFLDSDVIAEPHLVERTAAIFAAPDAPDAAFGSYVPRRTDRGIASDWKDLSIAWLHHSAPRVAGSFWSGCGAVRRETFLTVGGFDAARFPRPTVEDIDLGLRLVEAGARIEIHPTLEVEHLKRWTLLALWRSDVFDRAVPWSRLMRERGRQRDGMHLRRGRKLAGISAWAVVATAGCAPWIPWGPVIAGAALGIYVVVLRAELAWYARHGGLGFAAVSAMLNGIYLLYGSAVFALVGVLGVGASPRGSRASGG